MSCGATIVYVLECSFTTRIFLSELFLSFSVCKIKGGGCVGLPLDNFLKRLFQLPSIFVFFFQADQKTTACSLLCVLKIVLDLFSLVGLSTVSKCCIPPFGSLLMF